MKFMKSIVFITILLLLPVYCFSENSVTKQQNEETPVKVIDRLNYQVQIKQYNKDYPIVLYVVFKESIPLIDEIRKILRTEILSLTKTNKIKSDIIASAWFDNQVSEKLEKIELTKQYEALVFICDEKERRIVPFTEYIKYLKKKKEETENREKKDKQK